MPHALRSLRHANFRNFTITSTLSAFGTWMQTVAMGWLVYRLTGSPLLLGVVTVVPLIPLFPIVLVSGVISDRYPQRPLLIITEIVLIVEVAILALLTWFHVVQVWHIIVLNFGIGAMQALEQSPRKVFLMRLVGRDDLASAISLNVSTNNLARILGPALAGVLIGLWGEGPAFFLNALSFLPFLLILVRMRDVPEQTIGATEPVGASMAHGFRYAWRTKHIRVLLLVIAGTSFLVTPYVQLLPAFVSDVLGLDARGLGYFMALVGAGSALGALPAAFLRERHQDGWLAAMAVAAPLALIMFALSHSLATAAIGLFLVSVGSMILRVLGNAVLQLRTERLFEGRIISLYSLLVLGMPRLGALVLGAAAQFLGIAAALAVAGGLAFLWGLYVLVRMPHRLPVATSAATVVSEGTS